MKQLIDSYGRVHNYLRISLTDKCNLNCLYCNPTDYHYRAFHNKKILTYEEIVRVVKIFTSMLGFEKIRFTGGEPLVRKDILTLFDSVNELKKQYDFEMGLTTNGTLLEDKIEFLKQSGLDKLNISLDSLKPDKFKMITGKDNYENVIRSIAKAEQLGFNPLKINVVVIKDINDDELLSFVDFFKDRNVNIRFIEFMPFGNNSWSKTGLISFSEMKQRIEQEYNLVEIPSEKNAVAKDYSVLGYRTKVSFISSISNHFCDSCNRLRITSEGKMKLCLFSTGENEINFKELFADSNNTNNDICDIVSSTLQLKLKEHPEVEELLTLDKNNMLSIGG